MEIYDFSSYRDYVLSRVKAMPKNGHGQFMKIAKHISANPVVVTQVLKGDRDFSEEQSLRLANYLGLKGLETDYFMRMVALEKAGTHDLKQFHREAMADLKKHAHSTKRRVAAHQELDDSTKSVFYSDWIFSAVRLLTSIDQFRTPDAIAEHLNLSRVRVNEILEFLVSVGLCKVDKAGLFGMGVNSTHLGAQSRFVNNHHRNWRIKGLESLNRATPDEMFYSGPCTISESDFAILRKELVGVIASMTRRVPDTDPEFLACMNIDWFKV